MFDKLGVPGMCMNDAEPDATVLPDTGEEFVAEPLDDETDDVNQEVQGVLDGVDAEAEFTPDAEPPFTPDQ